MCVAAIDQWVTSAIIILQWYVCTVHDDYEDDDDDDTNKEEENQRILNFGMAVINRIAIYMRILQTLTHNANWT